MSVETFCTPLIVINNFVSHNSFLFAASDKPVAGSGRIWQIRKSGIRQQKSCRNPTRTLFNGITFLATADAVVAQTPVQRDGVENDGHLRINRL